MPLYKTFFSSGLKDDINSTPIVVIPDFLWRATASISLAKLLALAAKQQLWKAQVHFASI